VTNKTSGEERNVVSNESGDLSCRYARRDLHGRRDLQRFKKFLADDVKVAIQRRRP